jgi:hypothetical protein
LSLIPPWTRAPLVVQDHAGPRMLVVSGEEALETKHCAYQHRPQRNYVYAFTAEVVFWTSLLARRGCRTSMLQCTFESLPDLVHLTEC